MLTTITMENDHNHYCLRSRSRRRRRRRRHHDNGDDKNNDSINATTTTSNNNTGAVTTPMIVKSSPYVWSFVKFSRTIILLPTCDIYVQCMNLSFTLSTECASRARIYTKLSASLTMCVCVFLLLLLCLTTLK